MRIHLSGKFIFYRKVVAALVAVCLSVLSVTPPALSQTVAPMPIPGTIVHPSPENDPLLLRGLRVYLDDPFRLDFIVDENRPGPEADELRLDSVRSITYFLTALTIPRGDLWVNLSPFEQDRIVPDALGQTALGRDLLAQDYLLKQLTASFIHPDDALGKKFWDRVYREAFERYGTTDIPLDTFNKVWVVPGSAGVYEDNDRVIVVENHLKVMMEADYLAQREAGGEKPDNGTGNKSDVSGQELSTQIMREIVVPAIEREVNQGGNFAVLRQIYQAIILANWYKQRVEDAVLQNKYIDQRKLGGIDLNDPQAKQVIYQQYVEAFKKGVYEMIREENDPYTQEMIPRKYFSGGFSLGEKLDIQRYSPQNTAPSTVAGWFERLSARAGKGVKTILLSVLLVAHLAGAAVAQETATPAGPGAGTEARVSAVNVDDMMKKLAAMSQKGSLSTNEITGVFDLLRQADEQSLTREAYNLAEGIIINNRGMIFNDQNVLRAACTTLLAVQGKAPGPIRKEVDYLAGVLEKHAPEQFQDAKDAQARQNGPVKLLSSLTGEPLKNFTQALQGDFRLWIDQLKASPTNAQFAPLFEAMGEGQNLELINDLIREVPQTGQEAQTLVSNILVRLTDKKALTWHQSGDGVWQNIWVKDSQGKVLWQYSPMVKGPTPTFFGLFKDNMLLGVSLAVSLILFVPVVNDLVADKKVKITPLVKPEDRGGELLPGVARKLAELEAIRLAAVQPQPSTLVNPKDLSDQQIIDVVRGIEAVKGIDVVDDKVVKNLRNETTQKLVLKVRSGKPLTAKDITDAKTYLIRRYAARKGWETKRRREAGRKAALAAEQAVAIFPQTVEHGQFSDSFAKLVEGARQKLAAAPEASKPLWQGRLTALEQLRDFVLARYKSDLHRMILGDIHLQDSPEEFLTRLLQALTISPFAREGDQTVVTGPAIMSAQVVNSSLVLKPGEGAQDQQIVMPLSDDKETTELVEQVKKYSTAAGREDYFAIPWTDRFPSQLPPEITRSELQREILSYIPSKVLGLPADKAMTPVGGIDLNDNLLNVQSTGAGPRIRLKFEVDADRTAPFDGFIPQILAVRSLDLQAFFAPSSAGQK